VSFANQRGNYVKMLARLSESLRNNFDGDFLGFINENSVGSPLHSEVPFAFKIHCVQKAADAGYEKVLWLDSSCYAIQNTRPIFDEIEKDGFIFQDAGHYLRTWTNDRTLEYFGIAPDEAMGIKMIGNAGFLGFNLSNPKGTELFQRWKQAMLDGQFNNSPVPCADERFREHRWDMSCSSAIVYKMGLSHLMKRGDEWLQYAGPFDRVLNETIVLKAQGM
jgi:hypothetical protein